MATDKQINRYRVVDTITGTIVGYRTTYEDAVKHAKAVGGAVGMRVDDRITGEQRKV